MNECDVLREKIVKLEKERDDLKRRMKRINQLAAQNMADLDRLLGK